MTHILLKLLLAAPPLECQPTMLHQAPHHLNAVKFGAVGWQDFQRYPQLLQLFDRWLDRASSMDQRVAKHDHHSLATLLNNGAVTFRQRSGNGQAGPQCGVARHRTSMRCGWGGPVRNQRCQSRPVSCPRSALALSTPGVLSGSARKRCHLAFLSAITHAFSHQSLLLEIPDEDLEMDGCALCFGMQQFRCDQGFLVCPLHKPPEHCLVELAQRAIAWLVTQAGHAFLASSFHVPVPPCCE